MKYDLITWLSITGLLLIVALCAWAATPTRKGDTMLRSIAFTALLEWPEYARLEDAPRRLATLVLEDFLTLVRERQAKGDTASVWDMYLDYRRAITANETCDAGVLTRYAECLLTQREMRTKTTQTAAHAAR